MKNNFFRIAIGVAIFFVVFSSSKAFAATVNGDLKVDKAYIDNSGNLQVFWHRVSGGSMGDEAVGILQASTTNFSAFIAPGSGMSPASLSSSGLSGAWSPGSGACAPGFDNYSPSSLSPGGNHKSFATVFNGVSGMDVAPDPNASYYLMLVQTPPDNDFSHGHGPCGLSTSTVEDFIPLTVGSAINFAFPTNGTTTPQFSNFLLTFDGLNPTSSYRIFLQYFVPMVTGINTGNGSGVGTQLENNGLQIPRQSFGLAGNAQSSTQVAIAYLYDVSNFEVPNPDNPNLFAIASSEIVFDELSNGNIGNATTSYVFTSLFPSPTSSTTPQVSISSGNNPTPPPNQPAASSTFQCVPAADFTDIGGGLRFGFCSAINYLFIPSQGAGADLTASVSQFQNVLPFSIFFNIAQAFSNAAASTSLNTVDSGWILPVLGTPVTVLSSSTMAAVYGSSTVSTFQNVGSWLMWAGTGLFIILH